MAESFFGTEQLTDEDRAYRGSRFRDVVEALFANPYQKVWGRQGEAALPVYEVTLGSLLMGLLFALLPSLSAVQWGLTLAASAALAGGAVSLLRSPNAAAQDREH